jgi:3-oxoadipate enol-lactonase
MERNGLQIHYEILGDAGLPVLVLSHSLGANLNMWKPQSSAFSRQFRLLLYDMRGHGRSSISAGPFDIAVLCGDVLHLLDHLNIEQACFCGLSMGGVIGQWLGIHAGTRIRKLILASTAAKIGTEEGWNARIATVSQQGMQVIVPGTMERWFTTEFRVAHPDAVRPIEATLLSIDPRGYAASCAAIRDADFRESVSMIKIPTLVIAGAHDPATTPEDARFLVKSIAGSQYVELPAAHLSNVEAAGEFNAAVLGFLASGSVQ